MMVDDPVLKNNKSAASFFLGLVLLDLISKLYLLFFLCFIYLLTLFLLHRRSRCLLILVFKVRLFLLLNDLSLVLVDAC